MPRTRLPSQRRESSKQFHRLRSLARDYAAEKTQNQLGRKLKNAQRQSWDPLARFRTRTSVKASSAPEAAIIKKLKSSNPREREEGARLHGRYVYNNIVRELRKYYRKNPRFNVPFEDVLSTALLHSVRQFSDRVKDNISQLITQSIDTAIKEEMSNASAHVKTKRLPRVMREPAPHVPGDTIAARQEVQRQLSRMDLSSQREMRAHFGIVENEKAPDLDRMIRAALQQIIPISTKRSILTKQLTGKVIGRMPDQPRKRLLFRMRKVLADMVRKGEVVQQRGRYRLNAPRPTRTD